VLPALLAVFLCGGRARGVSSCLHGALSPPAVALVRTALVLLRPWWRKVRDER
jgi:hypothetical protein